jgi:hypothetical protein
VKDHLLDCGLADCICHLKYLIDLVEELSRYECLGAEEECVNMGGELSICAPCKAKEVMELEAVKTFYGEHPMSQKQ